MSPTKFLTRGHLQIIMCYANVERKFLKEKGNNVLKRWAVLTPLLNSLNNNAINTTSEGWKDAFQQFKTDARKKHRNNEKLNVFEKEFVMLENSVTSEKLNQTEGEEKKMKIRSIQEFQFKVK
ncbi:hypothetical protein QE152_g37351 [Popillia japonica]|uniref:Regulatory protein zeste n=1 Tax=Popillia japonica TaxID=7064 RepID=A0AAW1IAR5_POPJA